MEVRVVTESVRGCGYRKQGLYLMGGGLTEPCERLPFPIYGGWPRFSRSWLEFDPSFIFRPDFEPLCDPDQPGHSHATCPACTPQNKTEYLLWVGKQHYTPDSFMEEANRMGISKRIAHMPDGFVFDESWVFLAHLEGYQGNPGMLCAFRPTHLDYVVDDETQIPERAEQLREQYGNRLQVVKVERE